jgi:hypothetical protein
MTLESQDDEAINGNADEAYRATYAGRAEVATS